MICSAWVELEIEPSSPGVMDGGVHTGLTDDGWGCAALIGRFKGAN